MSPVERHLNTMSGQLISISEAAQNTPYSAEYFSLLARKGKLKAVKISRDWLTTREAVLEYVNTQALKHKKILSGLESVRPQNGLGGVGRGQAVGVRSKHAQAKGVLPPSVSERGRV